MSTLRHIGSLGTGQNWEGSACSRDHGKAVRETGLPCSVFLDISHCQHSRKPSQTPPPSFHASDEI